MERFQSPCGDLLIGNFITYILFSASSIVSVPLRGFINRKPREFSDRLEVREEFQSPCGDLLIGNQPSAKDGLPFFLEGFSPLAGIY